MQKPQTARNEHTYLATQGSHILGSSDSLLVDCRNCSAVAYFSIVHGVVPTLAALSRVKKRGIIPRAKHQNPSSLINPLNHVASMFTTLQNSSRASLSTDHQAPSPPIKPADRFDDSSNIRDFTHVALTRIIVHHGVFINSLTVMSLFSYPICNNSQPFALCVDALHE